MITDNFLLFILFSFIYKARCQVRFLVFCCVRGQIFIPKPFAQSFANRNSADAPANGGALALTGDSKRSHG
jgi:hypothetical protein